MMKIKNIIWESKDALEASVVITDGVYEVTTFCQPCKFALNKIDSAGNADKWEGHLAELFNSPIDSATSNGMLDLVTVLTKQ